jgi:RHS repeat-associated protein
MALAGQPGLSPRSREQRPGGGEPDRLRRLRADRVDHRPRERECADQPGVEQEYDIDTSLYFYSAGQPGGRWYDPLTQTFLSRDPLGLAPDVNPYRYVLNAPTILVDPSGLKVYMINRKLGENCLRSDVNPITHSFVFTTDENGRLLHTYSWGNDYEDSNPSHWYRDRPEDINAAWQAIISMQTRENAAWYQTWALPGPVWVGPDSLNDAIEEAFNRLRQQPGHPWRPWANCKHEAVNLLNEARRLRREGQPDHPRPNQ